jgi:Ferredoxin
MIIFMGVIMVKIIYIEHDGTEHPVDVDVGTSIMEGAVSNSIPGIDADCGGGCACATCMVFIGDEWKDKMSSMSDEEESMLDFHEI